MKSAHKADAFFEGNRVLVLARGFPNPVTVFAHYLRLRDAAFPLHPQLWLRQDGSVPRRSWFLRRLRHYFPQDVAGHSLRSGGATAPEMRAANLVRSSGSLVPR